MLSSPPCKCTIIANVHLEPFLLLWLDTEHRKSNEMEGLQITSLRYISFDLNSRCYVVFLPFEMTLLKQYF